MHEKGRGVARDLTGAFFDYARLAEAGDAWSQNKVGSMLALGTGVAVDQAEAVTWFRRAADQSNMLAVANLGVAYTMGEGVAADAAEGRRLLRRAIDSGDASALARVGDFYLSGGQAGHRDLKSAVELLRRAARLKNDDAAVILAKLYANGVGVAKDERRAFNELKEIAQRGSPAAKTELARLYLRGVPPVRADWAKARTLVEEAAGDGYDPAMTLHAILLKNGIGGARDLAKAAAQLHAAAEHDPMAKELLLESPAVPQPAVAPSEAVPPSSPRADAGSASGEESAPIDRQPVPVLRTPPAYPLDLRMLGITGTVIVDFVVDLEGATRNVHAVSSTAAGFEGAATAAVANWRFQPGLKRGRPVPTHMQVPIVFTLEDEEPATAGSVEAFSR